ncbi:hypothetical protein J6590_099872 [Homalodisca vitripennis]|nr:hypothetical protein J6590_099872 [Homalodisca vitripennis]
MAVASLDVRACWYKAGENHMTEIVTVILLHGLPPPPTSFIYRFCKSGSKQSCSCRLVLSQPPHEYSTSYPITFTDRVNASCRVPSLDIDGELWMSKEGSTTDYLLISNNGFSLQQNLLAERNQFWQTLPYREKPSVRGEGRIPFDEL